MNRYLSKEQIAELVSNNLYEYTGEPYRSRCFSGQYKENTDLPALAIPGGDLGDLAILFSAEQSYGFELNISKATKIFIDLVGKASNSTFKSITEHSIAECRYIYNLLEHSEGYNFNTLTKENFLKQAAKLGLKGHDSSIKPSSHIKEQACIILEAQEGLYPEYTFETIDGSFPASVFVVHKTLIDQRHNELAKRLYQGSAVKLYEGLNEDYLYEVISEMTDIHLFETIRLIDFLLPIFSVRIDAKGKISVEQIS